MQSFTLWVKSFFPLSSPHLDMYSGWKESRSDTTRSVIWSQTDWEDPVVLTLSWRRLIGAQVKAERGSYPEQDADSTGHAHLAYAHHRHFVPRRLRRATEQRA